MLFSKLEKTLPKYWCGVFDIQCRALFLDDIEKRKRLRQKKARDERRRERRIEIEENKKQGKCKS